MPFVLLLASAVAGATIRLRFPVKRRLLRLFLELSSPEIYLFRNRLRSVDFNLPGSYIDLLGNDLFGKIFVSGRDLIC